MKSGWRIALALFGLVVLAGEALPEIPPYLPERRPVPVREKDYWIQPDQVRLTTVDGGPLVPSEFVEIRSLNDRQWRFSGVVNADTPDDEGLDVASYQPGFDDSGWDHIAVPLNWYVQYPQAYQSPNEFAGRYFKGCYRRTLVLTAGDLAGRRAILHFGVIGYEARLFVNGEEAGGHHGDFVPWDVDITPWVRPGENTLAIRVVSDFGVSPAVRTYGSQWARNDIKAGLWQEAELRLEPEVRVGRVLISPDLSEGGIGVEAQIFNHTAEGLDCRPAAVVSSALRDSREPVCSSVEFPAMTAVPGESLLRGFVKLNDPVRWTPDDPHLYYLSIYLRGADGKVLCARSERFGFREFKAKGKNFHLNGERIYLFGENLPVMAFGGRGQTREEEESRMAKDICGYKSLGYNILRTAHMPALPMFYDLADELGMLVYDEWGWAFTTVIEEKEFARRNDQELTEWVYRDHNHPSVVMWSGGNEVTHSTSPAVKRQLDRQVDLIHGLDRQKRPAGSFSASASQGAFGTAKLNTDFVDLHDYLGMAGHPWTRWNSSFDNHYRRLARTYAKNEQELAMPYIIWECVGFSWGWHRNEAFKLNDIYDYAWYVKKEDISNWGEHYGIGLAGTLGLDTALKKGVCAGEAPYGRRILGLIRQNLDIQGFAPWFSNPGLAEATIWNQPVYCGLRNEAYLPPRHLFWGRAYTRTLFVVNSTNSDLEGLRGELSLAREDGTVETLTEIPVPDVKAWSQHLGKVDFRLPELPAAEHGQLRVTLWAGDRQISRNFHEIFAQSAEVMARPIAAPRTTAVLDCGPNNDVEATAAVLRSMGVTPRIVDGLEGPFVDFDLLVVPAIPRDQRSPVDEGALLERVRQGGRLLILEQGAGVAPVLSGYRVVPPGNTFVDLVIPEHPVFRSLNQECFDTWEDEERGYAVQFVLSPFSLNAVAVRGPLLARPGVGMAVMEAKYGEGRIFASQLDAVRLWGKDSVATTYLANVVNYMAGRGPLYDNVQPLVEVSDRGQVADSVRLTPIDLRPYANRDFADESDKGGPEGWTGQGSENDFRMMPHGRVYVGKIVFDVIDPATNNGKGALILRGAERPKFPAAICGIKIGGKFKRFFFLHGYAWGTGGEAGRYRFHYEDGQSADCPLVEGRNIGDWWNCRDMPEAWIGITGVNGLGQDVGVFVAEWTNPHPEKKIVSMDFVSAGCGDGGINFNNTPACVPFLVAMTGEAD
ncbi:MAG: glycoside hydrolase family 2 [Phycisphaerae bacterium]|nr:glycoside hydrolase family 2 [Phycisphaerae bacterium]